MPKLKKVDYEQLTRIFLNLGKKSDSDKIALAAIRSLHNYLAESGLKTSDLLRILTTDQFVVRIDELERANSVLAAKLAQIASPPESQPIVNEPPAPASIEKHAPIPRRYVQWQTYEIAMAMDLREKGVSARNIAIELNKSFDRNFNKSNIINLFNRELKN